MALLHESESFPYLGDGRTEADVSDSKLAYSQRGVGSARVADGVI